MQVEHFGECMLNMDMKLKQFPNVNIKKLCIIAEPSENTHIPSLATGKNYHRMCQTQVIRLSIKCRHSILTCLTAWWQTNLHSTPKIKSPISESSALEAAWQVYTLVLSSLLTYAWLARIFVSESRVISNLSHLCLFSSLRLAHTAGNRHLIYGGRASPAFPRRVPTRRRSLR